jgi:hypothetical protein
MARKTPKTSAVAVAEAPKPKQPRVPVIEVFAPTLNRPEAARRLEVALEGVDVPQGYTMRVNVQRETEPRALTAIVNEAAARSDAEILVVLADHIVPEKDFLLPVAAAFEAKFPDYDGMVGLNIANMEPLPGVREYCFFAVGKAFRGHFPECRIFCPDYYHFSADTELGEYAVSVSRFHYAEDARINTFHVNNGLAPRDETWKASRSRRREDAAVREARQQKRYTWGTGFERVNT